MALLLPLLLLAALFLWMRRRRRRLAAELSGLASARGWRCEQVHGLFGQSARVVFTPQDGSGWSLLVKTRNATRHSPAAGHTEFHAPSPVFPAGFALFTGKGALTSPGLLKGVAAFQRGFARLAGRMILRRIYSRDHAEHMRHLQVFEPPAGLKLAIQASADPRQTFDLAIIDRLINGAHGIRPGQPVSVMIGPSGLRVRLALHGLREPAAMDAFVKRCLGFRHELLRGAPAGDTRPD